MRVAELRARGVSREEAARRAREEFGDLDFTRDYCRRVDEGAEREARVTERIAELGAGRALHAAYRAAKSGLRRGRVADPRPRDRRQQPQFSPSLAPFSSRRCHMDRQTALLAVFESWPDDPAGRSGMSPPNFVDYRTRQHAFTDLAAYVGMGELTWRMPVGEPEMLSASRSRRICSAVLRASPLHGRRFSSGEGSAGNDRMAHRVVSNLAYAQLGAKLSAIGKPILLNGRRIRHSSA